MIILKIKKEPDDVGYLHYLPADEDSALLCLHLGIKSVDQEGFSRLKKLAAAHGWEVKEQ